MTAINAASLFPCLLHGPRCYWASRHYTYMQLNWLKLNKTKITLQLEILAIKKGEEYGLQMKINFWIWRSKVRQMFERGKHKIRLRLLRNYSSQMTVGNCSHLPQILKNNFYYTEQFIFGKIWKLRRSRN